MARPAELTSLKDATTEELAGQIEAIRADIASLTQTIAAIGKAKGAELSDAARERAAAAIAKGGEQAELLRQQALRLNDEAQDFVAQRPATSLGIAAGLGFVVGMLMSRR